MKIRILLNVTLLLAAQLLSVNFAVADTRLITTGSSTVAPLISEIAKRYEDNHPGTRIDVETGGSTRGVTDARRGAVSFGMASRALKEDENDLQAHTIAWDGVAMIVNSANKIPELSSEQIRAIYRGEISNWKEVGGNDQDIVVVNKAQGRSTLELFLEHFELKAEEIKADTIIGDNQQGIKLISQNPSAIGYVSIGAAEFEAKNTGLLRHLPLDGVASTTENVKNGTYPLRRPLNLVTKGALSPAVSDFIKFATSNKVNDLIEELYFVPQSN